MSKDKAKVQPKEKEYTPDAATELDAGDTFGVEITTAAGSTIDVFGYLV